MIYKNVTELIGRTPLMEVPNITKELDLIIANVRAALISVENLLYLSLKNGRTLIWKSVMMV